MLYSGLNSEVRLRTTNNKNAKKRGGITMAVKRNLKLAVALVFFLSLPSANAATISLVPTSSSVLLGGSIVIDVMLNTTDLISTGLLDFTYPSSNVSFASFSINSSVLDSISSASPSSSSAGQLNDFSLVSLGPGGTNGGRLATMTFNTVNTGLATFGLSLDNVFFGGPAWFWGGTGDSRAFQAISNTDLASFTLTGASVQINAVPIPAAVWLLGSGVVGLVALKRRKKA
jgi:hypothetical protein